LKQAVVLFVIVRTMHGIFSLGCFLRTSSSLPRSILPLNGSSIVVSLASSIVQSIAWALRNSMCPFVVSKWEFPGRMSSALIKAENRTFSAALPWWVGRK